MFALIQMGDWAGWNNKKDPIQKKRNNGCRLESGKDPAGTVDRISSEKG